MDELSSTEFRKTFQRLTEPVFVSVHGHIIGEWRPMEVKFTYKGSTIYRAPVPDDVQAVEMTTHNRKAAQAQRDAILNRVNRGRKP